MAELTFSTSGTLGDCFITVCKLYRMAQNHNIKCNHYTVHREWHDKIREIYSLLPSIEVNFVDERDEENPRVYSHFAEDDGIKAEQFPKFELPKMPMPKSYIAVNEKSGKSYEEDRIIPPSEIEKICDAHKQPVVLLGSATSVDHNHPFVFDMTEQTTIKEAFSIIRGADEFVGFQGLLSFFALSQKIPTTIYCRNDADIRSVEVRIQPSWRLYLKEIIA